MAGSQTPGLQIIAVSGQARVEYLDGDDLPAVWVEGAEDDALAPGGDLFQS